MRETAVRSSKHSHGRARARHKRLASLAAILALCLAAIFSAGKMVEVVQRLTHPLEYEETIRRASAQQGLEPALVAAVIRTESRFDPEATSYQSAYGLMQLLPETAKFVSQRSGIEGDYRDPEVNIRLGTWYLGYLKQRYSGDETLMLAAYNSGEGQVDVWLDQKRDLDRRIPFPETHKYVAEVREAKDTYAELYGRNLNGNQH